MGSPLIPAPVATDAQSEAIAHAGGPCLVVAAPGSGKTFVITRRFIRLVEEGGRAPGSLLVLAYNRRAADELQQRVEERLGPLDGDPVITTYHGWAQGLVRRFGVHLGWPEMVRVATDAERWLHLADAMAHIRPRALYNPARPYDAVREVKVHIERCKQELVTPDRYLALAEERLAGARGAEERLRWERARDLAAVYRQLQETYRREGIVDHDDTIALAAELLDRVPAVAEACAGITDVMVDEYQDTNSAQARMVELLEAPHRNLLVVADDDQAIYRFRGASRLNIDRFRRHFPDAREIGLLVNRRSTPEITAVAAAVIAPSPGREAKQVIAARGAGEPVRVVRAQHPGDEVQAVVDAVQVRLDAGVAPRRIAVLAAFRADLEGVARRLEAADIPYVSAGGSNFFRTPEIKAAMGLLEAVADPDEGQAILRCCDLPSARLGADARIALSRALGDSDEPVAMRLRRAGGIPELAEPDRERVGRLVATLHDLHRMSLGTDPLEVVSEAFIRTDFHRLGDVSREVERRQFAGNVSRLYELVEEYCSVRPGASYDAALEYLRLTREAGAESVVPLGHDLEGVVLSTIHSAKGLEWDHVIITAAVDGTLPRRHRGDGLALPEEIVDGPPEGSDAHVEEQRRLFYVALTRARDSLTLTWSSSSPSAYRPLLRTPYLATVPARLLATSDQPYSPPPPPRRRRLPELLRDGTLELSFSLVQAYRDCPRRFEYLRLWEIPPLHGADAWYGELLHAVLATALRLHRDGRPIDQAAIAQLWSAAWEGARGPRRGVAHLQAEGSARLQEYVASALFAPPGDPGHWIEHAIRLTTDAGNGHVVTGRVDRLDIGPQGIPEVIDYKTGRPNEDAATRSLQLKVYALAVARQFDAPVVRGAIHHLQTSTAATASWSRDELERSAWGVGQTLAEIARGHAECRFPARPSAWACSGCAYRIICPERADAWDSRPTGGRGEGMPAVPPPAGDG